jgi:F420 biosynthesis protein FbiB-like protein
LKGTTSNDRGGIDVWLGSLTSRELDAVLLTVDMAKRDAELKLLLGCSDTEKKVVVDFSNTSWVYSRLIRRDGEQAWLRSRRSVRRFQSRPVPEKTLRKVLETASWAPSSHNRQPWRFAVVQSPAARSSLAEAMGGEFQSDLIKDGVSPEDADRQVDRSQSRIREAPAAVLVCLDPSQGDVYPDQARQEAEFLMGVQSTALAGGYLLLAAHAVGLAGVWMCAPLFAQNAIRASLDLPEPWQPQSLVLLGYPLSWPEPRPRKPLEEIAIYR